VLTKEDLDRLGGFSRYLDVDGDGVGYRTLPGTPHPAAAYFTRGSGHNEKAQYTERPDDYVNNMNRLARKFESLRRAMPRPAMLKDPAARIGLIGYGTSRYAMEESRDQLMREYGIPVSWLRLKSYPFTEELSDFIAEHERVYVIEQNRDAQMRALMRMDLDPALTARLRSVLHYDGLPVDARSVTDKVAKQEGL